MKLDQVGIWFLIFKTMAATDMGVETSYNRIFLDEG